MVLYVDADSSPVEQVVVNYYGVEMSNAHGNEMALIHKHPLFTDWSIDHVRDLTKYLDAIGPQLSYLRVKS